MCTNGTQRAPETTRHSHSHISEVEGCHVKAAEANHYTNTASSSGSKFALQTAASKGGFIWSQSSVRLAVARGWAAVVGPALELRAKLKLQQGAACREGARNKVAGWQFGACVLGSSGRNGQVPREATWWVKDSYKTECVGQRSAECAGGWLVASVS